MKLSIILYLIGGLAGFVRSFDHFDRGFYVRDIDTDPPSDGLSVRDIYKVGYEHGLNARRDPNLDKRDPALNPVKMEWWHCRGCYREKTFPSNAKRPMCKPCKKSQWARGHAPPPGSSSSSSSSFPYDE